MILASEARRLVLEKGATNGKTDAILSMVEREIEKAIDYGKFEAKFETYLNLTTTQTRKICDTLRSHGYKVCHADIMNSNPPFSDGHIFMISWNAVTI